VTRAWAAADSGLIINPDGLANQIEGAVIQSTSWTLHEEVKFAPGGIKSRDWLTYPILTMPEVPKVEVELINRPRRGRSAPVKRTGAGSSGDRQWVRDGDRQADARPTSDADRVKAVLQG
jgi:CO/xanthine dehydrogenase Mo-binding subunit